MRIVAAALLFASIARAAGTPETFGVDPRTTAMAGASSATASGWSAAHTNPAQLALEDVAEIGGVFHVSAPFVAVQRFEGSSDREAFEPVLPKPYAGWSFGATVPIPIPWEDRLAVGFTAFFPAQALIHARAYDPITPFFYLYETYTDHYDISASAAVRLVDWAAIGAGLRLGAGQRGTVRVQADPLRQRITGQVIDTEQYPIASPQAGVMIGPLGVDAVKGRLSFVWREPVFFSIVLPAAIVLEGADLTGDLLAQAVANYAPRSATLGGGLEIFEQLELLVDVQYVFWSEAPPPFVSMRLDLDGEALRRLGLGEALDVPSEQQDRVPADSGFVDTLNAKVGLEWRLLDDAVAVRAGYQFRPTPVPDQTTGTNIVDCTAHVVGAGAAVDVPARWMNLPNPVVVEVTGQTQILQPRRADKADPTDPVGDWRASGAVHHLQAGLRYAF